MEAPIAPEPSPSSAAPVGLGAMAPAPAARVLVVEHHLPRLILLHDLLRLAGYLVSSASTSAAAFAALGQGTPDAVVLSLWLESPDAGWRVLEHLRADPATASVPVFVCAEDRAGTGAQAATLGTVGCTFLPRWRIRDELLDALTTAGVTPRGARRSGTAEARGGDGVVAQAPARPSPARH